MNEVQDAPAIADATPDALAPAESGLDTAHNARIVAADYIPKDNEVSIAPIQVIKDARGLGIFVGRNLLEFALIHGPHFNGPGQDQIRVTNGDKLVRAIGQQLTKQDEEGGTPVSRMLDAAMRDAIDDGCEGVEVIAYVGDPDVDGVAA